jgi:lipooligosaccharide transport system permease protein
MFLFSGIFFPFNELPNWVGVVAWFMPLYHLVEITRGLATGPELWSIAANSVWLLAVSALLFSIPVRALRKKLVA